MAGCGGDDGNRAGSPGREEVAAVEGSGTRVERNAFSVTLPPGWVEEADDGVVASEIDPGLSEEEAGEVLDGVLVAIGPRGAGQPPSLIVTAVPDPDGSAWAAFEQTSADVERLGGTRREITVAGLPGFAGDLEALPGQRVQTAWLRGETTLYVVDVRTTPGGPSPFDEIIASFAPGS
jgi:hypothetical protein